MYRAEEEPERFARQLGIQPDALVEGINVPGPFLEALGRAMFLGGDRGDAPDMGLYWPWDMAELKVKVTDRMVGESRQLNTWWVVIAKKPAAEARDNDLRFQAVLDAVLPTGWVDNKTLTFSEEEYGIRFVPRLAIRDKA